MSKEIANQEDLVKTSAEGSVELSEADLKQVAGGQKTQPYLKIEMEDVLVSSYSTGSSGGHA